MKMRISRIHGFCCLARKPFSAPSVGCRKAGSITVRITVMKFVTLYAFTLPAKDIIHICLQILISKSYKTFSYTAVSFNCSYSFIFLTGNLNGLSQIHKSATLCIYGHFVFRSLFYFIKHRFILRDFFDMQLGIPSSQD